MYHSTVCKTAKEYGRKQREVSRMRADVSNEEISR
jgi:hypothetical protein